MPDIYITHPALEYWRSGQYGGRGYLNRNWIDFRNKDEMLSTMALCVELVFGGDKVIRVATRDIKVTDQNGYEIHFQPLLVEQPSIKYQYTVGNGSSSAQSISLSLPSKLVNPQDLIANNKMLAGIGEVSLLFDGAEYEDRIVIIRGEMDSGVTFGPSGTFIETSIVDPKDGADVSLPPYVVTEDGFSDAPEESIGERFQLIMPAFNYVPAIFVKGGATGTLPYAMVCEGHSLSIDKVYVDGVEYATSDAIYGWETVKPLDGNGNPYTAIYFNIATSVFDFSEGVYADLSGGSKAINNPIAQIRALATEYSVLRQKGINAPLFAKAESRLANLNSRVCVNAGGASNTSTLSFIEGEFLSSFPMVSMVFQNGSYGPIVTDRTQVELVVDYLTAGQSPLMSRSTIVSETPRTEVFNEFTLRYNYNAMDDVYESVETRTRDTSIICRVSQDLVGYRPMDVIDSVWITESATANAVIDWMVAHQSLPSYYVEYQAHPWMFFRLNRGDNIRLTDDEFGWSEQMATVQSVTLDAGICTIGFRVWSLYTSIGGGARSFSKVEVAAQ